MNGVFWIRLSKIRMYMQFYIYFQLANTRPMVTVGKLTQALNAFTESYITWIAYIMYSNLIGQQKRRLGVDAKFSGEFRRK